MADKHPCIARDHEYKRLGTLSLLAGIDLLTGQVHACVEDRHRSREFIGFLKKLDAAYPSDTRNVSTTLIHPGLEFKLGLGHMAPPIAGHAGSGLPEGKIACEIWLIEDCTGGVGRPV